MCHRTFTKKKNLDQHSKVHSKHRPFKCSTCDKRFHRKQHKNRHEKLHSILAPGQTRINFPVQNRDHQNVPGPSRARSRSPVAAPPPTRRARSESPPRSRSGAGLKRPYPGTPLAKDKPEIYHVAAAFKNATITWKLICAKHNAAGVASLLDRSTRDMKSRLIGFRSKNPALKFNMAIHITFQQQSDDSITTFPPVVLVTEQMELYPDDNLEELLKTCSNQLQNRITNYEGCGSGWTVQRINSLDTTVWVLNPLRGESYHELSQWIKNSHCTVNVKNEGNRCFEDAVMAGLYRPERSKNVTRPGSYKEFYERDDAPTFSSLTFPVKLRDTF